MLTFWLVFCCWTTPAKKISISSFHIGPWPKRLRESSPAGGLHLNQNHPWVHQVPLGSQGESITDSSNVAGENVGGNRSMEVLQQSTAKSLAEGERWKSQVDGWFPWVLLCVFPDPSTDSIHNVVTGVQARHFPAQTWQVDRTCDLTFY